MGTEIMEANLAQQLVGLYHDLLLQVLLDVYKAYKLLDRGRCMEIMMGLQPRDKVTETTI